MSRTHEQALAAARNAFLADGFAGLTHLELARRSGIGRKTLYRHWPTVDALVYATLDSLNFPRAARTGELHTDLVRHLEALRRALADGPLAFVIHALGERSTIDSDLQEVRRRLIDEGCAPIRAILRDAIESGQIDAGLDVERAAGELEGPVFYRALVHGDAVPEAEIETAVASFVARHESAQPAIAIGSTERDRPRPSPRSTDADR